MSTQTLHDTIDALAEEFARRLLRALRSASLDELAEVTGSPTSAKTSRGPASRPPGAKRRRRSPEELRRLADYLVTLVMKKPKGIRAEDLKRAMGVPPGNVGAKAFTKPLSVALASKRIKKRGARRWTTYHAA